VEARPDPQPLTGRDRRHEIGRIGERAAAEALDRAGLRILDRRYRKRFGEIDIVAVGGDLVVFVEVKTRTGSGAARPAEAVTPRKQARMARVALAWLQRRGWLDRRCRFDVVEVWVAGAEAHRVRHLPDAFRLGGR
jgi:putative endonuclease